MKVLIVGGNDVSAIENYYSAYLKEEGVLITRYNAPMIFHEYYGRNIFNKFLFKAGYRGIYKKINKELKKAVQNTRPDIVWVFKGMEIFPSTLRWIRKQGIFLANYNPDNPFIFTGKGSGNDNITNAIQEYDLHFTYNMEVRDRLLERFQSKVVYLPFGFDLPELIWNEISKEPEIVKACFIGNPDSVRVAFIRDLIESGIHMDLYGNGWGKMIQHPNAVIFSEVKGKDFWSAIHKYRVQLNLMRVHNENSHNMRTFEVTGAAGIMLAPDTPEHRLFFQNGEEVFLFQDVGSCVQLIRHLLSLNNAQAGSIRNAARLRSIHSGYSYQERSRFVKSVFESLLNHSGQN